MESRSQPLVSVITPVYNNAGDLAECIESVLAQTYSNWEYKIINNCSTDGSREIAHSYAAKDTRIKVIDNQEFLKAVANHNHSLLQIAPDSKYCKFVFADDWIFPECLEQMVSVAEEHPTVGIVGAYGLQEVGERGIKEYEVVWGGLPYPSRLLSGRDVCRRLLFEKLYVFGTSTSVLYRSDLVRSRHPFFNEANLHADMEVAVELLKATDFSFIHQILTFKRWRSVSLGTFTADMYTTLAGHLHCLAAHGRGFLSEQEFEACLELRISEYYNFLGVSLLRGRRDGAFWDYHRSQLINAGVGFSRARLAKAIFTRLCKAMLNPPETMQKLMKNRNAPEQRLSSQSAGSV
ncbi:glycosyltransferase involved in cell wall biosynthesis [Silvibacterium bohemicum]|uniref:Glycosyltransferase involved in cell wall biosynthesis n=1 Tax=Silvibacterium bohemicum TaxID=1577686 RepID=A0A841JR23_9BACT|nr:glycosyltransferase family 2 protein [Silvibacterium bohemicum]MBB6142865.1 glycosyltransferase involved in cell wall biosynthesis [Silvibacterium bohemicum]